MPEINIERLTLSLSGLSEDDGKNLAQHIADGLASASVPDAATGSEAMQSSIIIRPGSSMPDLASQIVADLVRQLNRSW
jgi:hypothetical protein